MQVLRMDEVQLSEVTQLEAEPEVHLTQRSMNAITGDGRSFPKWDLYVATHVRSTSTSQKRE